MNKDEFEETPDALWRGEGESCALTIEHIFKVHQKMVELLREPRKRATRIVSFSEYERLKREGYIK